MVDPDSLRHEPPDENARLDLASGYAVTIGDAFNATVDYYDDWMRIALPGYADLFGTATDVVPAVPQDAIAHRGRYESRAAPGHP
jgi:hypothetical protein